MGISRSRTEHDKGRTVFDSNLDNFINCQICADGSVLAALADEVCFICLLPVHRQSVFIAEDCYSLQ